MYIHDEGNTLLHNACTEVNTIMGVVGEEWSRHDLLKCNRYGEALIHIACKHARLDI